MSFQLERVTLIKDGGGERESEIALVMSTVNQSQVWNCSKTHRAGGRGLEHLSTYLAGKHPNNVRRHKKSVSPPKKKNV